MSFEIFNIMLEVVYSIFYSMKCTAPLYNKSMSFHSLILDFSISTCICRRLIEELSASFPIFMILFKLIAKSIYIFSLVGKRPVTSNNPDNFQVNWSESMHLQSNWKLTNCLLSDCFIFQVHSIDSIQF